MDQKTGLAWIHRAKPARVCLLMSLIESLCLQLALDETGQTGESAAEKEDA